MKKAVLIPFIFLFANTATIGQKTQKVPVKKAVVKPTPPIIKNAAALMPLMVKNEDGSTDSYDLVQGDKLVYHVNSYGREYDFIVTLNDAGFEKGVDFDYEMTAPINVKGHVIISKNGKEESAKYHNFFRGGELNLTEESTVWITGANFREMPSGTTTMTFDDGNPETLFRPENDIVTPSIKYKGKEVKLDGFIITNGHEGKDNKTLWVQNTSANPLILKMNLGWTIELKEVR